MSTILDSIPPAIEASRRRLFALEDLILLTKEEWDLYLPYINNIWSRHVAPAHNPGQGKQTAYYRCRLHPTKAWAPPDGPKRAPQSVGLS